MEPQDRLAITLSSQCHKKSGIKYLSLFYGARESYEDAGVVIWQSPCQVDYAAGSQVI